MKRVLALIVLMAGAGIPGLASTPPALPEEVTSEHNAGRRSELALDVANDTLDRARKYYEGGETERGNEQLELVGRLANECLDAAREAHRSRYFKKAEMKVEALAKRVRALKEDLNYDQRDRAEQLANQLDSIHDKLLAGVMGK